MKKLTIALAFGLVSINASAADIANGEALAKKTCVACHGADFATPIDPSYPKLAGQHADYLATALAAYKRGDSVNGRVNPIMSGQVATLSSKDIKDIAAYLASLPASVATRR